MKNHNAIKFFRHLILLSQLFPLTACLTANSSLQSGRTLREGESNIGINLNFFAEYDDSVFIRRNDRDFGSNYNPYKNDPHFGLGVFGGHGFNDSFEINGFASIGTTGFNAKYGLYSGEKYASAIGIGTVFPTLSWDYIETYAYTLSLYHSYDLLENATVYINPVFIYDPGIYKDSQKIGCSLGLVSGRGAGLILEWSYYESVNTRRKDSVEVFNIGLVSNLEGLKKEKTQSDTKISLYPVLGSEALPFLTMGLRLDFDRHHQDSWELETAVGIASLPEKIRGTKEGYTSISQYGLGRVLNLSGHWLKFGFGRREIYAKLLSDTGWHRIAVKTNGFFASFRNQWQNTTIDWVGIYFPIDQLGTEQIFVDTRGEPIEPAENERGLARFFRYWPSISFLKTVIEM